MTYLGPVGPAERDKLLGGARALLHLIGFAEPFGLSVVEALATGTPVIATPLGSMPELIRDGVTGFLVSDVTPPSRRCPDSPGSTAGTAARTRPTGSVPTGWSTSTCGSSSG